MLLVEIDLAEHLAHQIALFDADAMLAGQDAAEFDAYAQDVGAERFRPLHLARLVGIVEDQRMQIAVAGVKHVGDGKIVFFREIADPRQGFRQRAARDGAVHAEIVGRNPSHRRKCGLAPGPEQVALTFRIGNLTRGRPAALRDRFDPADQLVDLDARTIELDDQQRLDVERIARMHKGFGGVDRGLVHHLHAARDNAGADDAGDAFAGRLDLGKAHHQRPRRLRLLQDPHRDFRDDAEQPLGARDDAHQIVAAIFGRLAADSQDFAGHQNDLAAQHVVGGHAVFQAMHAAGIFRDIASDRAGDLRRRVGRVVETGMRHRLADGEVGHAGFGHHDAVVEIDLADALEFAEAEQHAVGKWQRATGQRGAGAARHHLDALLKAIFQHFRDLLGGVRQHHDHRRLTVRGQGVGLVGQHLGRAVDDALARHDRAQRRHDGVATIKHRGIRGGHHNGHGCCS